MKLGKLHALRAFVLASILLTVPSARAQSGGYSVVERGPDYKVLQKITVEHGTNRIHRYTELATGMHYTNSFGQLAESREEITVLPDGTAEATHGRHAVQFPADIYDGVLHVTTPDGRNLYSRPLCVCYDDGTNSVVIGTLTNAIGCLTAPNQVTYPNCFAGLKADLVATYKKSGFECDLVFRGRPPTPDVFGLAPNSSTLELVTEFFNTQDPQQLAGASEDWLGLQDTNLKFGKLTMRQGKAFATQTAMVPKPATTRIPVFKSWVHAQDRTFLIERVSAAALAKDLNALPLSASVAKPVANRQWAVSGQRVFPPSHGILSTTNQILLAVANRTTQPGVILDYNEIDSGQLDFTFQQGQTYLISDSVYLGDGSENGTAVVFESGSIIKFSTNALGGINYDQYDASYPTSSDLPAVLTSADDNSVGEAIGSGNPVILTNVTYLANVGDGGNSLQNMNVYFAGIAFSAADPTYVGNCQFYNCLQVLSMGDQGEVDLFNDLFSGCAYPIVYGGDLQDSWSSINVNAQNVTADSGINFETDQGVWNFSINFFNCLMTRYEDALDTQDGCGLTSINVPNASCYTSAGAADYYLSANSPYRGVGTQGLFVNWNNGQPLLAQLETMTTYAPQDGGYPDTSGTDLGYHYPVNEDSTYDGIPDWWIWQNFGNYTETATNLDASGNTLLYDYENGLDPNVITFSVRLGNQNFKVSPATGNYVVYAGIPSYEAVLINDTNWNDAIWQPYDGNISLTLGSTNGAYSVWFGLKGYAPTATPTWMGTTVYLNDTPPLLTITSPTNGTTAVPYVQVRGYANEELQSLTYDLSNAVAVVTNQPGSVTGHYLDPNLLAYTTNYFQCYDIPLTNGLNVISVHATDMAGNVTTSNLALTLDYTTAAPPVIQLAWPTNGMQICAGTFTLRGWVDDPTATITASVTDTNGDRNIITGIVERTGVCWANDLPLAEGINILTLCVTNAAGLSSETNISLVKCDMTLTLTNIAGDLWLPTVSVSGLISDPTDYVWVNGVQGKNNGDGTWNAENVPVSSGGVASFDLKALSPAGGDPDNDLTTNKNTEQIVESDTWGSHSTDVLQYDTESDATDGTYSYTNGGMYHDHFVAQYPTWDYTVDTYWVLGPGGVVKDEYWYDSLGNFFDYGPGGACSFAQEEGTLKCVNQGGFLEQDKNSKPKIILQIGGTGAIGQKVLVAVNADATEELASPVFGQAAPKKIDAAQISIPGLGKNLGADGWAYGTASIGQPVEITPTASAPMYSFNLTPGEYSPVISVRGNGINYDDISVTNPEFCVGQQLTFCMNWSPPNVANANYLWHLPDKYVNEQYQYSSVCTSYRKNTDLLTNATTQCWYVRDPGGACSVREILQFSNGQSVNIAAAGNFTIYRPSVNFILDSAGPVALTGSANLLGFDDYLTSGDINFHAVVTSTDFSGDLNWTQLINRQAYGFGLTFGDQNTFGNYDLDNDPLYNTQNGNEIGAPPQNTSVTAGTTTNIYFFDAPGVECEPINTFINDSFKTYLAFHPQGDGIWVTLGRVDWGWSALASDVNAGSSLIWQIDSASLTTPTYTDTDEFPVYPNILHTSRNQGQ